MQRLAICLLFCFVVCCWGESHFSNHIYTSLVSEQQCLQKSRKNCPSCGLWSECCEWVDYTECQVVYKTVTITNFECEAGWQSSNCDVPICNPPCSSGKNCKAPNRCECVATKLDRGADCTAVACSSATNCYPGSCYNNQCSCPSSFQGENCESIIQTPVIEKCSVQLIANGNRMAQADCSAPGLTPPTTWITREGLTTLQASWEAVYTNKISMPDRIAAPNIKNSPVPIGVTDSSLLVTINQTQLNPIPCTSVSTISPTDSGKCDITKEFADLGVPLEHNVLIAVVARAKLGGQKIGMQDRSISNSIFGSQPFNGSETSRSVQFKIDMHPPVHCLKNPSNHCLLFPIYLDKDIRTNPQIQPKFENWTDDGSGVNRFHVEIYFMQPAPPNNRLVNTGPSLRTSDISPSLNNFIYTCTTSGVYSIELTVFDQANNSAKARKIFIYNSDSKLQTVASNPVYVREANPSTGYTWITNLGDPIKRDTKGLLLLTLDWTNRFKSTADFSGSWGLGVEPWTANTGIDDLDSYEYKYGMRTISALTDMPHGITSYSVGFIVDQTTGGRGGSLPNNTVSLNSTENTYQMKIPSLRDGSAIVIWLECNDVAGGLANEKLTIHVDSSLPRISEKFTLKPKSIDEFTSSVFIRVFDEDSGIKFINFSIFDATLKLTHRSDTAKVHMRDPPAINQNRHTKKRQAKIEQPCTPGDESCYCIPQGLCYNYEQQIDIDHCWIDRFAGHALQLKFTATNLAGLMISEKDIDLRELKDIPCRPTPMMSLGGMIGIGVGGLIGLLVFVALIVFSVTMIRVYAMHKPVPQVFQSVRKRFANDAVTSNNELYMASDAIEMGSHKDNRYRKKQAGGDKFEDDIYVFTADNDYIENPKQMNGYWIPKEKVKVEAVLSTGRMMVVSRAQLTDGNQRNVVAVKALKNGSSKIDLKLIEAKTNFMATLKPQVNLVKFIGAVRDETIEGPIMVLEFCEITLQQWLTNNSSITVDVLENMLTFCLNIARGLEHLHSHKIIHTRLAARNVLLAKQFGGYVAKLIGFGPNRESEEKDVQVAVPVKWLAPETLRTINKSRPTYNEKTDAWCFAITAWEIYSRGKEQPYPELSSNDAKVRIKAGEKMERPENCPPELFDEIILPCWELDSNKRPSIKTVSKQIENYRKGMGSEPIGYYDTKDEICSGRNEKGDKERGYCDASSAKNMVDDKERGYCDASSAKNTVDDKKRGYCDASSTKNTVDDEEEEYCYADSAKNTVDDEEEEYCYAVSAKNTVGLKKETQKT